MMKPLLSNELLMSFGSQFNTLTSRDGVQTVGSAARPWTNVAAFARLSAMVNGSGRLANAVDSLKKGGILVASAMRGGLPNLVTTVLEDWDRVNTTHVDGKLAETSTATSLHNAQEKNSASAGLPYTLSVEAKAAERRYLTVRFSGPAFADQGVDVDLETGAIGTQWNSPDSVVVSPLGAGTYRIDVTATSDSSADGGGYVAMSATVPGSADGNSNPGVIGSGLFVSKMRIFQSAIPHAAPPVGSIAGYTYATDQLSQPSVVYTGDDFIVIAFMPYGWDDVDNPSTATPIIFEAGALQITLDASGFYATNGGAVSTKKPVADTLSVMYLHFDGANHTISVDNETPVVNASVIVPTGTTYGGNLAAGTEPAHAILVPFVGPGSESATNITLWNTELQSRLGGIVTQ